MKDVSFEIRRDEIFGLVGESGSGKSTVGKCLMGILSPEAETLSYDGINLLDKKQKEKCEKTAKRTADDLSGFNIFLKPENEGREDSCRATGNT